MVKHILAAWQKPCNEINSKIFTRESNNCPISTKTCVIDDRSIYPSFNSIQKIIHRFLSCNKIIFLPHVITKFTESELAKKLNITADQLKHLQRPSEFYNYEGMAKYICLPLIDLYSNTLLQRPESVHNQEAHHA
jgi:hypothetical protein